jgi:hypothetical protein
MISKDTVGVKARREDKVQIERCICPGTYQVLVHYRHIPQQAVNHGQAEKVKI